MKGLDIAIITAGIGLGMYTVSGLTSILFHKLKKQRSFIVSFKERKIIIRENPITTWFGTINYFSILSMFTFFVAFNRSGDHIYLQLCGIYVLCITLAGINFYRRKKILY